MVLVLRSGVSERYSRDARTTPRFLILLFLVIILNHSVANDFLRKLTIVKMDKHVIGLLQQRPQTALALGVDILIKSVIVT